MVSGISRGLTGWVAVGLTMVVAVGCRGRSVESAGDADIQFLVDSLVPLVEITVGLEFRSQPQWAVRSPEQLQTFLRNKLREQLPPEVLAGVESAYRLFGFIPDTLDLEALFLKVLSEQVQGFYEPDSATLFLVEDAPLGVRITLAHELVHALQDQYLPLDSLMDPARPNDQLMALQAILEGQAHHASMTLMAGDRVNEGGFWDLAAEQARQITAREMPEVPLALREQLLFPYVDGARFMEWWSTGALGDTMPYGPRLPVSTEQILHPTRYLAGDTPVALAFADSTDAVMYQDDLGEFGIRVLHAQLLNHARASFDAPIGWNGDLYRVYRSDAGPALVWYSAWDDAAHADRFVGGTGALLADLPRPEYRGSVDRLTVGDVAVAMIILAPADWEGWTVLPVIRVEQ